MAWSAKQFKKDSDIFSSITKQYFAEDETSKELAFHLSDIAQEIVELGTLIQKIRTKKKCSTRELDRIQQCLCYHWPYHQEEILKLMLSVDGGASLRKTTQKS